MSRVFFDEMNIAEPDVNLGVGSGSHAWQTGQMLMRLEPVMQQHRPDWVLVYGDTNSTLAGALAASKLGLPLAHVEAGLRSFNREMPEEHNRILTDHCATLLFCPTQTAMNNLAREGLADSACWVGDTMFDAVLQFAAIANERQNILQTLNLKSKNYLLATLHRPYNTDTAENLHNILAAFSEIGDTIVFPVHPRTRKMIAELEPPIAAAPKGSNILMIEPIGYLDMLMLEQHAKLILTDSGGVQKEAFFFAVPCVTLRPETEWIETLGDGWNVLVGADRMQIVTATRDRAWPKGSPAEVFGDGQAAHRIVAKLTECLVS